MQVGTWELIKLNSMKKYWKIYGFTLAIYVLANLVWIDARNGLEKDIKIVATSGCMIFLLIAAVINAKEAGIPIWKVLLIIPLSIVSWALLMDYMIGLTFHGNPFYLSDTWPDSLIEMPGELYYILKSTAAIVFSGLLYYIRGE